MRMMDPYIRTRNFNLSKQLSVVSSGVMLIISWRAAKQVKLAKYIVTQKYQLLTLIHYYSFHAF